MDTALKYVMLKIVIPTISVDRISKMSKLLYDEVDLHLAYIIENN